MPGFSGWLHYWELALRIKVLQQQSNKTGFTSTWTDDFDGRLRTQIANGASLPSIYIYVATMPAEHSGFFGTKSPVEDCVKAHVTRDEGRTHIDTAWSILAAARRLKSVRGRREFGRLSSA